MEEHVYQESDQLTRERLDKLFQQERTTVAELEKKLGRDGVLRMFTPRKDAYVKDKLKGR